MSFPGATNHFEPLSGGANEGNDGAENTGVESGMLINTSGLNVACGSSSRPNQEMEDSLEEVMMDEDGGDQMRLRSVKVGVT